MTKKFKKAVIEIPEAEWNPLYKTYNGVKIKTETISTWEIVDTQTNEVHTVFIDTLEQNNFSNRQKIK